MNAFRQAVLALAAGFAVCGMARADIIIDDFSAPNPGIDYLITFNTTNGSTISTPNILPGVNRSITLTVTSPNPGINSMGGTIGGPDGWFTMSLNNSSAGTALIVYDFAAPMNFVPTGVAGSLQYLSSADSGFGTDVPMNFVINTTGGDLSFNGFMSLTSTFTPTDVALSSFTGTGDLTEVTGMSIEILGGQAADVALTAISITTPEPPDPDPIPAPPAAVLALLALPVLGWRHRRNRNAKQA